MYCATSVHVEEPRVVKISGAFHYGVTHSNTVVLGRTTPEITIAGS